MKYLYVLILLTAFIFPKLCFSQNLEWSNSYLSLGKINANSYNVHNYSDNTIKVKVYKQGRILSDNIIKAKSSGIIKNNIVEYNRYFFNDYKIYIYYDLECYKNDVEKLNRIAKNRYLKAKRFSNWENGFSVASGFFEAIGSDRLSKVTGNISALMTGFRTAKEKGIVQAGEEYIISEIEDKIVDTFSKKKWQSGSIKAIRSLDNWSNEEIKLDNSDLEYLALEYTYYISEKPIFNYTIDYDKTIRPYVDYDNDNITNYYDSCKNDYGPKRFGKDSDYSGCSKKMMKLLKKRKRKKERVFNKIYIDANLSYSDYSVLNNKEYGQYMYNKSAFFNASILLGQFNIGNSKGAFSLDGGYRSGTTYIKKLSKGKDLNLFVDDTYSSGISFLFMVNRLPNRRRIVIQPKIGYLINTTPISKKLRWADSNKEVPEDLVIVDKQGKFYFDLNSKISLNKGGYGEINSGINFGVRYVQNPRVIKNEKYNYITKINGDDFMFPKNSIYLYGGIYLGF